MKLILSYANSLEDAVQLDAIWGNRWYCVDPHYYDAEWVFPLEIEDALDEIMGRSL